MEPEAEERFAALASRMSFIEKSVDGLDRRCADIEGALMTNTGLTERTSLAVELAAAGVARLEGSVSAFRIEMREALVIIRGSRRFGRVMRWLVRAIHRVARWAVPLVTIGAAIWAWLHGLRMPK